MFIVSYILLFYLSRDKTLYLLKETTKYQSMDMSLIIYFIPKKKNNQYPFRQNPTPLENMGKL